MRGRLASLLRRLANLLDPPPLFRQTREMVPFVAQDAIGPEATDKARALGFVFVHRAYYRHLIARAYGDE